MGLAVAAELKRRRPGASIVLLEKESSAAQHASGRNSGVIHAGFYYTPDSLKSRFTAEGNRRLREFCASRGISMNPCGKVVVARSENEIDGLQELARRGDNVGAGTRLIDEKELAEIDSNARTVGLALLSPNTVTVSPREVCAKLQEELETSGVKFYFRSGYLERTGRNCIHAGARPFEYGHLINCTGLYSDKIARQFGFASRFTILPFKGVYLVNHASKKTVSTNIYPVPNLKNPFLGVHFTITADGHEKIGPTAIPALWRENYSGFSNFRLGEFLEMAHIESNLLLTNKFRFRNLAFQEMRKYFKGNLLRDAASLVKVMNSDADWRWGPPGIRAQLLDLDRMELVQDFQVEGDKESTHVLNAVSPAFTSSFPFADHVVDRILGSLS